MKLLKDVFFLMAYVAACAILYELIRRGVIYILYLIFPK